MAETKKRKRAVSVCLGCIKDFDNTELFMVSMVDNFDLSFSSYMCKKCVDLYTKENNFKKFEVVGPLKVVKPRKPRTTKKKTTTAKKKTTTTKRKYTRKAKK